MGGEELDCHMAALQPCIGVWHWKYGISKLKQCTGCEHWDFQIIVVAVIAGAVPDNVLCTIHALIEFIFQAQSLLLYDEHLHALGKALQEFHTYKNSIINSGGWQGKKGPIMHFNIYIPKLEGMNQVAWNVSMMGTPTNIHRTSQRAVTSCMWKHPTINLATTISMNNAATTWIALKKCTCLACMFLSRLIMWAS